MMYAIIETGGKQIRVEEGAEIFVEKLPAEAGEAVEFDKVLLVSADELKVGKPYVEGAKVSGKVLKRGRGKKLRMVKYKPKKGRPRRKQGHRQPYTKVVIESIEA